MGLDSAADTFPIARLSGFFGQATLVACDVLARLEPVLGAAVGTHCFTGRGDIEENARVMVPDRHAGIGTESRQVLCGQFDQGEFGHTHHHTFVSQCLYFAARPLTTSKNSAWIFSVTGPRAPRPIGRPSSSRIGVTSAAVPVKKASSAR